MNLSNLPLSNNNYFSPSFNLNIHNKIINNNAYNLISSYFDNSINNNNFNSIRNQNEHINIFSNFKKKAGKKSQKKIIKKFKEKRPSDWICNRCNNLNYSFRTSCNLCQLPLKDNPYYKSDDLNDLI